VRGWMSSRRPERSSMTSDQRLAPLGSGCTGLVPLDAGRNVSPLNNLNNEFCKSIMENNSRRIV